MNLTEPSPKSTLTPPGWWLLGGITARREMKKPQDREFGGVTCRKMCCPHNHGAPMNSGNWLFRSLMLTAWHSCMAWSGVVGDAGEKKTSAIGLTIALLPSARTRSL